VAGKLFFACAALEYWQKLLAADNERLCAKITSIVNYYVLRIADEIVIWLCRRMDIRACLLPATLRFKWHLRSEY
jgi:hypothetical protein